MARLKNPRSGSQLLILKRPLEFSFWPTYQGIRRAGLQSTLFVTDPWSVIRDRINRNLHLLPDGRTEAIAYLDQAEGFYNAVQSARTIAATPLLMYYCFMNLAKAFVLSMKMRSTIIKAQHGLSERIRVPAAGSTVQELTDAYLEAFRSSEGNDPNVFSEFMATITGSGLADKRQFDLPKLIPQLIPGHRLWAKAAGKDERFISIARAQIVYNTSHRTLWIRCLVYSDDLTRLGLTHKRLLNESMLGTEFRLVKWTKDMDGRRLLCFEQKRATAYLTRPSDSIRDLITPFRKRLWTTVLSAPPYRQYYLYLCPAEDQSYLLPQLLSIYSVVFYLGSITRYRPQHFAAMLDGEFGAFVKETLTTQPGQFLYLLASEFAEQEITKPAIV